MMKTNHYIFVFTILFSFQIGSVHLSENPIDLFLISKESTVYAGQSLLLTCVGLHLLNDSISLVWQREGQDLAPSSSLSITNEYLNHRHGNFRISVLMVCDFSLWADQSYTCIFRNSTGVKTASVSVSVNRSLELTYISENVSSEVGSNMMVMCKAYGGPDLNIVWSHKEGRVLSNNTGFSIIHEEYVNENGRLLKKSSLHLSNLVLCDSGEFHCEVSDLKTSHKSSLWINVIGNSLKIIDMSISGGVQLGQDTLLSCSGYSGSNADVKITWMTGKKIISNSPDLSFREDFHIIDEKKVKRSFLTIKEMDHDDIGTYTCVISVRDCSVNSSIKVSATNAAAFVAIAGGVVGAVVPVILIVALLVFGVIYYYRKKREESAVDYEINKVIYEIQKSSQEKTLVQYGNIFK